MDWLTAHADLGIFLCTIAGFVFAFARWNIVQGVRLKDLEKSVASQDKEIQTLQGRQDNVIHELSEDLKRIGERLAHIEGFLRAQKVDRSPRAR